MKSGKAMLKALYLALTAVSCAIVVLFLVHQLFIRPPELGSVPSAPTEASPAAVPTPAPDTLTQQIPPQASDAKTRKQNYYTFLLAATDQISGNADSIIVMSCDTARQQIGMVSILRDTLVDPDGPTGYPKINYAGHHGVETLREVVSDLLGIPIDFYVLVDIEGFNRLMDLVGGIEFYVPVHMGYDDDGQNLHIHYEEGLQTLNAEDIIKVCRFRKNNDGVRLTGYDDVGRTKTQRDILTAVAKKLLCSPQKLPQYISLFAQYVDTNLTLSNMLWFAEQMAGLDVEASVTSAALPGDGEVTCRGVRYCYELYSDPSLEIINSVINPFDSELTPSDINVFHPGPEGDSDHSGISSEGT